MLLSSLLFKDVASRCPRFIPFLDVVKRSKTVTKGLVPISLIVSVDIVVQEIFGIWISSIDRCFQQQEQKLLM